jgi:riboflavin kinase/FMN adenylyltransferase
VNFKLTGKVVGGKKIGRTLGFPTANVEPDHLIDLPKNGIYAAWIAIPGEEKPRLCVLSQGVHPTLPEGKPTIEAYILDFDRDIYGETVELEYFRFLRPEIKFDSVDALIAQMKLDVFEARRESGNA